MEIGYCLDCNELNYAITNKNGNFERANMSNNHKGTPTIYFFSTGKIHAAYKKCFDEITGKIADFR